MKSLVHTLASTLLFVLFALVVTPVGVVARLVRDPLQRRPDPRRSTYWTKL